MQPVYHFKTIDGAFVQIDERLMRHSLTLCEMIGNHDGEAEVGVDWLVPISPKEGTAVLAVSLDTLNVLSKWYQMHENNPPKQIPHPMIYFSFNHVFTSEDTQFYMSVPRIQWCTIREGARYLGLLEARNGFNAAIQCFVAERNYDTVYLSKEFFGIEVTGMTKKDHCEEIVRKHLPILRTHCPAIYAKIEQKLTEEEKNYQ